MDEKYRLSRLQRSRTSIPAALFGAYPADMTPKDVTAWIAVARAKKKWTQEQLGEKLGVTKANVSHWETGKHDPSFLQLLKIRDLTGHPLQDVLAPEDWPFPGVPLERVRALEESQLRALEIGLLAALSSIEKTSGSTGLLDFARSEASSAKRRAVGQ